MNELPIIGQGKPCGECSLCCKLLGVQELQKPPGKWCDHFEAGAGCSIYAHRPEECVNFLCTWKGAPFLSDDLRPDKSGVILFTTPEMDRHKIMQMHVDPKRPDAWNATKEIRTLLSVLLTQGFQISLTIGTEKRVLTSKTVESVKALIEAGIDVV